MCGLWIGQKIYHICKNSPQYDFIGESREHSSLKAFPHLAYLNRCSFPCINSLITPKVWTFDESLTTFFTFVRWLSNINSLMFHGFDVGAKAIAYTLLLCGFSERCISWCHCEAQITALPHLHGFSSTWTLLLKILGTQGKGFATLIAFIRYCSSTFPNFWSLGKILATHVTFVWFLYWIFNHI